MIEGWSILPECVKDPALKGAAGVARQAAQAGIPGGELRQQRVTSPHQFAYFQAAGFDASLLSFLQIDRSGSVNVSKLSARPHVTAGAGGFVDITARARKIVFSGYFNAGAGLAVNDGALVIEREGKIAKIVEEVEQVSFSGPRAVSQGQDITYVTERCVMQLTDDGLLVTEIAPGVDLERDILAQVEIPLKVAVDLQMMPARLFRPEPIGLGKE